MRAPAPPILNAPVVLLRVDADPTIGLGHLVRTATLADGFLRKGARALFATRTPEAVRRRRPDAEILELVAPRGSDADAAATVAAAQTAGASVAVFDDYAFDARFVAALGELGARAVWIDDGGFADPRPGVVLNHNVYATPKLYPGLSSDRTLTGPGFALLRDEFIASRRAPPPLAERPRILVAMGGADPPNFTARVLETLGGRRELDLRVLVGALNPAREALVRDHGARASIIVDPPSVAAEMAVADLAISAAGGTAMELCCVGVPTLVVALADNQRPVAAGLVHRGLALDLGWHSELTSAELARAVDVLLGDAVARAAMVEAQHALVDGRGKERAAERVLGLLG